VIAHAAVDAGAGIVIGHGPHYSLPIEMYRGKPIFYGLGSFSFHTGHGGRRHGDWIGMMARVEIAAGGVSGARFRFVRHNAANETVPCALGDEGATCDRLAAKSAALGASLVAEGDWVRLEGAVNA
jgi:poly-gamma-glutamate synthesis protein (capsule biosynthesis protein)